MPIDSQRKIRRKWNKYHHHLHKQVNHHPDHHLSIAHNLRSHELALGQPLGAQPDGAVGLPSQPCDSQFSREHNKLQLQFDLIEANAKSSRANGHLVVGARNCRQLHRNLNSNHHHHERLSSQNDLTTSANKSWPSIGRISVPSLCLVATSVLLLLAATPSHIDASGAGSALNPSRFTRQLGAPRASPLPQAIDLSVAANSPKLPLPYTMVDITRACEWKSNLFVPKSNDVYFAQHPQQAPQPAPESGQFVYETFAAGRGHAHLGQQQPQPPAQAYQDLPSDWSPSSTMLTTESKALVLALPVDLGSSFAGFEPACSIRLIVPPNMRILAKLTSRRLAFAMERQPHLAQLQPVDSFAGFQLAPIDQVQPPSLWINVSQNGFIETDSRTIETEANVLAIRLLLERFANKKHPDTRFQLVLTAFQTLSENSDLSGLQPNVNANGQFQAQSQLICDQQRLISATLACDGFKNCQDGHDEEPQTCVAFRSHQLTPGDLYGGVATPTTSSSANNTKGVATSTGDWMTKNWTLETVRSLAGYIVATFLGLLFLVCFFICLYFGTLIIRHHIYRTFVHRRRSPSQSTSAGHPSGTLEAGSSKPTPGSLTGTLGTSKFSSSGRVSVSASNSSATLVAQNLENARRQRAAMSQSIGQSSAQGSPKYREMAVDSVLRTAASGRSQPPKQRLMLPQPPSRLQSILKRPQQSQTTGSRPSEPPPKVPLRPAMPRTSRRSVSSLSSSSTSKISPLGASRGVRQAPLAAPEPLPAPLGPRGPPLPAQRLSRPPSRPIPMPPSPQHSRASPSMTTTSHHHQQQQTSASSSYHYHRDEPSRLSSPSRPTTSAPGSSRQTRVTTYHFSAGSTKLSESYLERLGGSQSGHHDIEVPPFRSATSADPMTSHSGRQQQPAVANQADTDPNLTSLI